MNVPDDRQERSAQLARLTRYGSATAVDPLASLTAICRADHAATQRCLLSDRSSRSGEGKGLFGAQGERYACIPR